MAQFIDGYMRQQASECSTGYIERRQFSLELYSPAKMKVEIKTQKLEFIQTEIKSLEVFWQQDIQI